jgi:hypothetical protein
MNVAATIIEQLSGTVGRLVAMTGARDLLDLGNGIAFKLPRGMGPHRYIEIVLEPSDTYTVQFCKIVKYRKVVNREVGDVYADNLRELFEAETGLAMAL